MALVKNAKARAPIVGHVKIGRKSDREQTSAKGNKYRNPEKLEHFLLTTLEKDASENFKIDLSLTSKLAVAGAPMSKHVKDVPALTEIPIFFHSDDIDDIVHQSYDLYAGASATARCDGENLTCYIGGSGKRFQPPRVVPCRGEHDGEGWKLHTRLVFGIRSEAARFGGLYDCKTTGQISSEQLVGSLQQIRESFGMLAWLPLWLVVRPMKVAPNGIATEVYVLHVELRGADQKSPQQIALGTLHERAQFAQLIETSKREARRLLSAPPTPEEDKDNAEEFHPDTREAPVKLPAAIAAVLPSDAIGEEPAEPVAAPPVATARPDIVVPPRAPAAEPISAPVETYNQRLLRQIGEAKDAADLRKLGPSVGDDPILKPAFEAKGVELGLVKAPPPPPARKTRTPPAPPARVEAPAAPAAAPAPAPSAGLTAAQLAEMPF